MELSSAKETHSSRSEFFLKSLDERLSLFDAFSPYEMHTADLTEIYHLYTGING